MKFLVPEYDLHKLPPGTAMKKETLTYQDYRTVPTLEEARKRSWFEHWFSRGKNHREEKGMVVCEVPQEAFVVEIKSLSDLVKLLDRIDGVAITKSNYLEAPYEIDPDPQCY